MDKIYPQKLKGKFDVGFTLSNYSSFLEGGRTDLGEKLYQFKHQRKKEYLSYIVEGAVKFVNENQSYGGEFYYADMIIPVPPSNEEKKKEWWPACMIAKEIGNKIGKFVPEYTLRKIKPTPPLKDTGKERRNYEEKAKIIKDTLDFTTEKARNLVKEKEIILIDDVYQTGATADEVTELLKQKGQAKAIYFLAITRAQS